MHKSVKEALSLEYKPDMYKKKYIYSFFKRLFDIISSFLGIILLLWLFIIIALLVKCTSKGPVFYGHERLGKNGKYFKVLKFRSMKVDNRPLKEIFTPEQYEEYQKEFKVTNDPRITKVGKFLRKTSLDELPQLFNIFIGQMSVIGWRPIITDEYEKNYNEDEKALLIKTKPGLTGFWASHGRSEVIYANRVKMELYYNVKRNVILDIRILFWTVIGVFKHEGAK